MLHCMTFVLLQRARSLHSQVFSRSATLQNVHYSFHYIWHTVKFQCFVFVAKIKLTESSVKLVAIKVRISLRINLGIF